MGEKINYLKAVLDSSKYTVVLCGSGILAESGCRTFHDQDYAYEIEQNYGRSPEDIFSSAYYMTRPDSFFDFYKAEVLKKDWEVPESCYALKEMEEAGKIQCILTDNIFDFEKRAGCRHVLSLRGSIYQNRCPKCGQTYSMEYIRDSKKAPRCQVCGNLVRPGVTLYGEQLDSHLTSLAATEVEKADVLLLIGTRLSSSVYSNYVKFFGGEQLVVIHEQEHYTDVKADMVIYGSPRDILSELGYALKP